MLYIRNSTRRHAESHALSSCCLVVVVVTQLHHRKQRENVVYYISNPPTRGKRKRNKLYRSEIYDELQACQGFDFSVFNGSV